jgi:hypothetical protein
VDSDGFKNNVRTFWCQSGEGKEREGKGKKMKEKEGREGRRGRGEEGRGREGRDARRREGLTLYVVLVEGGQAQIRFRIHQGGPLSGLLVHHDNVSWGSHC